MFVGTRFRGSKADPHPLKRIPTNIVGSLLESVTLANPSFAMGLLTTIWNGLKYLVGLVFPIFSKAKSYRLSSGARWVIHIILVAAVLVGLHFLNINWPWLLARLPKSPLLRENFLPILFLLLYVLCWLGWWLWKLLEPDEQVSDFPDIDRAWQEAMAGLGENGIDITRVPLFLVLGRPEGREAALFGATQIPFNVKAPARPDAPVHVYANHDGVWVTCAGASLLGRQAALLAGEFDTDEPQPSGPAASPEPDEDDAYRSMAAGMLATMRGDAKAGEVQAILLQAAREGRPTSGPEKRRMRQLMGMKLPQLLQDGAEVEKQTARLEHLCRLIVRERRPWCPLNGLLLLIPYGAAESTDDAQQTGDILQRDLATARRMLKARCPTFALICDLETVPGFRDLVERFPPEQRVRRVGKSFPLAPELSTEKNLELIDQGVQWVCKSLIPNQVCKRFKVEGAGETATAATESNGRLYQLMSQLRERRERFGRVLTRGLATDQSGPLLFGGCYVAATGKDPGRDQAFVAGVFRRLPESQNFVSWTDEALAEESQHQTWSGYLWVLVGVLVLAIVGVGVLLLI